MAGEDEQGSQLGDRPKKVIGVVAVTASAVTVSAKARTRTNFSLQHLLVAVRLAKEVDAVETANARAAFGEFYDLVLGSSVGCVVLATAAAEAYANEMFADRAVHFSTHNQVLLTELWAEYERKRVWQKFDLALRLRTGDPLDRGGSHAQALERLVLLRNALAHFKPEWSDEQLDHYKLSQKLEEFCGRSPWFPTEPLFPRAWATAATTSWAISAVVDFIAKFSADSGIPDRFAKHRNRLSMKRSSSTHDASEPTV